MSNILQIIETAEDFPALPHVILRLFKIANDPDAALSQIADVISADASLSVRILKMVNSDYYSFQSPIKNVNQAVSILGLKAIRDIALTLSILDIFPKDHSDDYKKLFQRSLYAGVSAALITEAAGTVRGTDAFTAALLQNLGMFIFMRYLGNTYQDIINEARENCIEIPFVEKNHIKITNAQAGCIVAERWHMPEAVYLAIKYQYNINLAYKKKLPKDMLQIIELAHLGGIAADFYTGWNKNFKLALFRTKFSRLFRRSGAEAEDVLSSIPSLIRNLNMNDIFDSVPGYEEVKISAELEMLKSYTVFNRTYNRLRALEKDLKEKKQPEMDFKSN